MPKNKRHYRVCLSDVIHAHEEALQFGGRNGVRDVALLESAIGRPYVGYYRSIQEKAAALLHSLATNHGFIDGNKRTALLVVHMFLDRSGYELASASEDVLQSDCEQVILDIIVRNIAFDDLVLWMRERVRSKANC